MSLSFAILGLLTFQPMSGYTLKSRYFDRSIAHFWPADQAQIYRTLQQLEAGGAVESEVVDNSGRPNSKLYAITSAGRESLEEWLAATHKIAPLRDAFLVQLYFGRLLTRDQMLAVLRDRRAEHARQLDYFRKLQLPEPDSDQMRRQLLFGEMTLDFARRNEAMMLDWLDACIATVAALSDD